MQMWVKDAAANKFLKLMERRGGGACRSSRFLTFLKSTQTEPFPTSHFWVRWPGGGGYGAGMSQGAKSAAPMHSPWGGGEATGRAGPKKQEFTPSRESGGGESALPLN